MPDSNTRLGDIDADEMRMQLHRMADWIADYRENIGDRAISLPVAPGDTARQMSGTLPRVGASLTDLLHDVDRVIMPGIVHWGHPSFLGYFGSSSNGPALLGEMVAAALNVSAMTWKTSPAATEVETVVLQWIRDMIGLPVAFHGVVYDTASVGLLHALAAARARAGADIRRRGLAGRADLPVFRIYASEQAHSSIEKAAIVLGIGEENVVRIQTDDELRMDVRTLRDRIDGDARAGFHPLAVIATVGTTSTASIDCVPRIAEVCIETGAWLHVDAAYGGAMAVLPERRWILAGVANADSFIINPHKWLFVPLDFSALYVRDPGLLRSVFTLVPEYLRGDASEAGDELDGHAIDYMDYGIQLGRRFRALKAWYALRSFGRDGIEARIREHCRLAELFASWVRDDPDFDIAAPVTMAVVCFRLDRPGLTSEVCDALNENVVNEVNASGAAYLTFTRVRGRAVMRVGFGNMQTTEEHARSVWNRIREIAQQQP